MRVVSLVTLTAAALLASATISVAFFHQPRPSPRFRVPPPQMGPPPPPPLQQQQQHLHHQNFPPFNINNPGQGFPPPPPPPPQHLHHAEPGPQNRVSGRSMVHPQQLARFSRYFPAPPPCVVTWPDNPLTGLTADSPRILNPPRVSESPTQPISSVSFDGSDMEKHNQQGKHGMLDHAGEEGAEAMTKPLEQEESCSKDVNMNAAGRDLLLTSIAGDNCPEMTWDDALNFCQSAGLRGLSLGNSKTEEDIEELMSKALDPDLRMETFWVAGYVLHPPFEGGKIQLKWVTESADETAEDVVPGTGHWSTYGLDGRMQPDNWLYRTSPPPADEAKLEMCLAVKVVQGEVGWHDLPCAETHPVVCEESDSV